MEAKGDRKNKVRENYLLSNMRSLLRSNYGCVIV